MGDINILERKPTPEELRNYTPVGYVTIQKKHKKIRVEKEQEYVKKHEPFCARCADLDFTDMWEDKLKEISRKIEGGGKIDETKITFNFPDLDKYGKKERFKKVSISPIVRDVIVDGVKVPKKVGDWYNYRCKERGCGIAVEIALQDFTSDPKPLDEEKVRKTE